MQYTSPANGSAATNSRLAAAARYLDKGWQPLPVPAGTKIPALRDWPNFRVNGDITKFFSGPGNIGILTGKPSRGLTDVDIDSREALILAPQFLPKTGASFGHRSKPRSHLLYLVEHPPATVIFRDTVGNGDGADDRSVLLELRSTGGQTIFPPSTHPTGEVYEWIEDGEPARIDPAALLDHTRRLAAAALLVRHYPAAGVRHDFAMALSGALLRLGWSTDQISYFLAAVAGAAGDEELRDRVSVAEYTKKRIENAQPATGWPRLAEIIGQEVTRRLGEWLGYKGQAAKSAPNAAAAKAPSVATALIELGLEHAELFHFGEECFASIDADGHLETLPLGPRTRGCRPWLSGLYFDQRQKAASSEALTSALSTLERYALKGVERQVYVRAAGYEGKVFVDLADKRWNVVEISAGGARVIRPEDAPVRFRRPHGMLALPSPEPDGELEELRTLLNVANDDDFLSMEALLVGAFHPEGPYPISIFHGEAGSTKTTVAKLMRGLVDPNLLPLRPEPREERDLAISARNGLVCAFDNLSHLPVWLADSLCRLSSGGGFSSRTLYTDLDETVFAVKRPVILTAIEEIAVRGDLLDRSMIFYLPPIPEEKRLPESVLLRAYEEMKPRLLGALYNRISTALANVSGVQLKELPRLADFAIWVTASEPVETRGEFVKVYAANRREANELSLETLVDALRKLSLPWEGTASKLLRTLEASVDDRAKKMKSWPSSGRSLSNKLRSLAPNLRQIGIFVEFWRDTGKGRERLITLSAGERN